MRRRPRSTACCCPPVAAAASAKTRNRSAAAHEPASSGCQRHAATPPERAVRAVAMANEWRRLPGTALQRAHTSRPQHRRRDLCLEQGLCVRCLYGRTAPAVRTPSAGRLASECLLRSEEPRRCRLGRERPASKSAARWRRPAASCSRGPAHRTFARMTPRRAPSSGACKRAPASSPSPRSTNANTSRSSWAAAHLLHRTCRGCSSSR